MSGLINNGFFLAIVAHGLIGGSLVWDKVLLRQPETKNLVSYVFWLGAISIFGLLLIPFGFHMPEWTIAILGFTTGVVQLAANFFYYAALKAGEASQTLAVMGGFSPVATALIGIGLLDQPLGGHSELAFSLLVLGGFVMFLSERVNIRAVLPTVIAASGTFGLTNVLEKVIYDRTNFVTGYVFFTFGTFAGAMFLLARRSWREQIFAASVEATPRSRFWYMVNRFISGVGSFLVFFAISRTNPAIVDAISGVRYVIIFLGAYLLTQLKPAWLREDFSTRVLVGKSIATLLVAAGLVLLAFGSGHDAGSPGRAARRPISGRDWCGDPAEATGAATTHSGSGARALLLRAGQRSSLEGEQEYAAGNQSRSRPPLPVHALFQKELGEQSLHHVACRCCGDGETEV